MPMFSEQTKYLIEAVRPGDASERRDVFGLGTKREVKQDVQMLEERMEEVELEIEEYEQQFRDAQDRIDEYGPSLKDEREMENALEMIDELRDQYLELADDYDFYEKVLVKDDRLETREELRKNRRTDLSEYDAEKRRKEIKAEENKARKERQRRNRIESDLDKIGNTGRRNRSKAGQQIAAQEKQDLESNVDELLGIDPAIRSRLPDIDRGDTRDTNEETEVSEATD